MGGFPIFFKLSTHPISNDPDECNITVLTTLINPQINALNKVGSGDTLSIEYDENTNSINSFSVDNEFCGIIISSVNRLKFCISKGTRFEARVLSRDGAECQIIIRKKL